MPHSATPFKLSSSLSQHSADVRSVSSPSPSVLISSSRDKSAIAWVKNGEGKWDVGRQWSDLGGFVGAVWGGQIAGESYVATGSQDSLINIYAVPSSFKTPLDFASATSSEPIRTLVGHENNVCCLDGLAGGDGLVSGSWDKTAIVWSSTFQQVQILKGHEQSVWAVKSISPTQLLTGSADKTIISWNKEGGKWKQGKRFIGHSDAVRGLCAIPGGETFASCGNDGTIIIWSLMGEQLITLQGHTSFVYSLAIIPSNSATTGPELASVGEDRTLRIWSEIGQNVQTITLPATSVWTVAATSDGDLVTGSSDGIIRVWTRNEDRVASEEELKTYDAEVSKQQIDQSQIGDIKKENLPGQEVLAKNGTKEGQIIMVKSPQGVVNAHQWSMATRSWVNVGEVVGGVGSGQKKLHDGIEYDYIFDVDIAEGAPPLKLPYNVSENPYMAAKLFLEKNELPPSYLEQVVKFIESQTAGATLGGGANEYVDPYTGASRYQSSASSVPTHAAGPSTAYIDPYSGTGGYRSGTSSSALPPALAPKKATNGVLPVETYLGFKQANVAALGKKLLELAEAEGNAETKGLKEVLAFLSVPKTALPDPSTRLSTGEGWDVAVLVRALESWSVDRRFPLLDLARILAPISPSLAAYRSASDASIFDVVLAAAEWNASPWQVTKEREINTMLAFRMVANLFFTANGCEALVKAPGCEKFLDSVVQSAPYDQLNKNLRVALSTIVLNYSILAIRTGLPRPIISTLLLDLILKIFEHETSDAEVAYRTAVAFGNLILSPSASGSLQIGKVQRGKQLLRELAGRFQGEKRLDNLAEEIGLLAA